MIVLVMDKDEEENDDANDRGSSYNDLESSDSTLVAWDILKAHLRLKHRKAWRLLKIL